MKLLSRALLLVGTVLSPTHVACANGSGMALPSKVRSVLQLVQHRHRHDIIPTVELTKRIVVDTGGFPASWPYTSSHFEREDESDDSLFYSDPRLGFHIDDAAITRLTQYYASVFENNATVLDLCSSWVSHFPDETRWVPGKRIGLGMNEDELKQNTQLDEYVTKNLNVDPKLPFDANAFDIVTLVVSVDYLNNPKAIFHELWRVLKPGGIVVISQSNRCFPSKVINLWLETNDHEHCWIIASYFHFTDFVDIKIEDISPSPSVGDPLFIVSARKPKTAPATSARSDL
eukprot:m.84549 g.84549  ORF g.84549 m.84549 type:complete len:288 (+) comp25766_c0_seq1:143-1006(+)